MAVRPGHMEFGRSAGLDRACRTTEEVVQGPLASSCEGLRGQVTLFAKCDLAYGAGAAKALKARSPR